MTKRFTRRAALSLLGTAAFGAPPKQPAGRQQLPRVGEFVRFADEITEIPVVRLTDLASASFLPARENRSISVKGRFLVFSSDRAGKLSPFRLDLRSGQVTQLFAATDLAASSLGLDGANRVLCFLDGGQLKQLTLSSKRVQVLVDDVSGYSMGASPQELITIRKGKLYGLDNRVVAEDVVWCQLRPGNAGYLFARGDTATEAQELWYRPFRTGAQAVRLAAKPIADPCWSPSGASALFLRNRTISEVVPESGLEQQIGGSSRFASFSSNADSSVFVGAARSKAQPTVNLLLRSPVREFTLCEHKASHPETCVPVFSADSRRVYFNSDFQSKPAIYSVNVESLIEETSG